MNNKKTLIDLYNNQFVEWNKEIFFVNVFDFNIKTTTNYESLSFRFYDKDFKCHEHQWCIYDITVFTSLIKVIK